MTPKLSEKICFHSMIFKKVLELHNNLLRSPIIHGFLQISPLTFRKYACSPFKKISNFTIIHQKVLEFYERHLIYHKSAKHSKLTKTILNFTTTTPYSTLS
jgi:hypothetical protein